MNRHEIIEFISTQILQASDGYNVETNKLDFKREWYKLDTEPGVFEFLKDICAIVNSYGGGSGFLVIGVDDRGNLHNSPFRDSNLKDDNSLYGLIKSKVDRPFNIELIEQELKPGHNVNIIHIPPSQEKPHVIRCFKKGGIDYLNEIFVRKSSGTERASKADIDLMYAEKGAILIERNVSINVNIGKVRAHAGTNGVESEVIIFIEFIIENIGLRPMHTLRFDLNLDVRTPLLERKNRNLTTTIFAELSIEPNVIVKNNLQFRLTPNLRASEVYEFANFFNELRAKSEFVSLNYLNILLSDGTYLRRSINTIYTGELKHTPKVYLKE